jgi:nuclear pore complex protein Nup93
LKLDKLLAEWNSSIRDYLADSKSSYKGDIYKYALYKIIGRCELSNKNIRAKELMQSTEDYMWLQLMLNTQDSSDPPLDKSSLRELSLRMQKIGSAHFKTSSNWFMVLLLCGEFEFAVSELYKNSMYDAIHFAIAMVYYGVLRVPESPKTPLEAGTLLSSKTIALPSRSDYKLYVFHFHKMVTKFFKQWILFDTSEMLHYLCILGLLGAPLSIDVPQTKKEFTQYLHRTVLDVLTETNKYAQILGQFKPDGTRIPGQLEIFRNLIHISSEKDFLDKIVKLAAEQSEKSSRYDDAIQLYHLSGQCNSVIKILNKRMGN